MKINGDIFEDRAYGLTKILNSSEQIARNKSDQLTGDETRAEFLMTHYFTENKVQKNYAAAYWLLDADGIKKAVHEFADYELMGKGTDVLEIRFYLFVSGQPFAMYEGTYFTLLHSAILLPPADWWMHDPVRFLRVATQGLPD